MKGSIRQKSMLLSHTIIERVLACLSLHCALSKKMVWSHKQKILSFCGQKQRESTKGCVCLWVHIAICKEILHWSWLKTAEIPRFQPDEDMALLVYIHKGHHMYSLSAILYFWYTTAIHHQNTVPLIMYCCVMQLKWLCLMTHSSNPSSDRWTVTAVASLSVTCKGVWGI